MKKLMGRFLLARFLPLPDMRILVGEQQALYGMGLLLHFEAGLLWPKNADSGVEWGRLCEGSGWSKYRSNTRDQKKHFLTSCCPMLRCLESVSQLQHDWRWAQMDLCCWELLCVSWVVYRITDLHILNGKIASLTSVATIKSVSRYRLRIYAFNIFMYLHHYFCERAKHFWFYIW